MSSKTEEFVDNFLKLHNNYYDIIVKKVKELNEEELEKLKSAVEASSRERTFSDLIEIIRGRQDINKLNKEVKVNGNWEKHSQFSSVEVGLDNNNAPIIYDIYYDGAIDVYEAREIVNAEYTYTPSIGQGKTKKLAIKAALYNYYESINNTVCDDPNCANYKKPEKKERHLKSVPPEKE